MRAGVLIQEEYAGDDPRLRPWRVVVSTLMCQQTSGRQVRPVLDELFKRWPMPEALAVAGDELEEVLRPTGFFARRAEYLRELSSALAGWVQFTKGDNPPPAGYIAELRGCGAYTVEAYKFVILGDRSFRPIDKELRKAWNRDRGLVQPGAAVE